MEYMLRNARFQNFVCQQHCPQPRVMKCTWLHITTILYIVSEMNVAAKTGGLNFHSDTVVEWKLWWWPFFVAGTSRCTCEKLSVGGGMGIMNVFLVRTNTKNRFVMWIKVRACQSVFFPIISGTLHPHLCDYDQLAQPMSAASENLGMQRDEDRHFSPAGKTIGWHHRQ